MGSGNIGATNVLRSVGLVPALVVVILDPVKGYLATALPLFLGMDSWVVALSGLAVVLGNNFNVFLKFRGGKGIATSAGVLLAIEPFIFILVLALSLVTMVLGRYVSLGSLVSNIATPLFLLARGEYELAYMVMVLLIGCLAFYKHRENIARLKAGNERRIGESALPKRSDKSPKPQEQL